MSIFNSDKNRKIIVKDKYALEQNYFDKALVVYGANEYEKIDIGTKVIFTVNKNGVIYGFMIYGRTGYAVKPFDIISSSITTLSYHIVNTIRLFTEDANDYKEDEALQLFIVPSIRNGIGNDISKVLLKSMANFMLDLQEQYPNHIKVIWKRD